MMAAEYDIDPALLRVELSDDVRQRCDHAGCEELGEYRAPKSRDALNEYFWFCLAHVRAYNAQWNYYAGMSEDEVEAENRKDAFWHRPTWPMGERRGGYRRVRDQFGLFDDDPARAAPHADAPAAEAPELAALSVLDLAPPVTVEMIKSRYKELAKRHHPDANGGSKQAEERLKAINQAYSTLMAATAV